MPNRVVHSGEHVLQRRPAPVREQRLAEGLAAAAGASRVDGEHDVARRGEEVLLLLEAVVVLPDRTSLHTAAQ